MRTHIKAISARLSVYLLVTCFSFFVSPGFIASGSLQLPSAAAQNSALPSGWESYLDRPDILSIPSEDQNLGLDWQNTKKAHFSFVAELLEMYPKDTHLYFLARDSEHLYDVARLVTQNTKEASRIHLLNVSRANMRDPNLKAYLKENGISDETLNSGRKVLFIDTGFSGTIPEVIGESFPQTLRAKLKTHLVVSANPAHPSSRAFLVHLNPLVNGQAPSSMHATIISYEHMPRYTDRSSQYVLEDGRLHPISPIGKSTDGSVSKTASVKYMRDFRAEWDKAQTKELFQRERLQFREIKRLLSDKSYEAKEKLKSGIQDRKDTPDGRLFEAQIRDLIEGSMNAGIGIKTNLADLDLKANDSSQNYSKKNELVKKFPEWAPILQDPDHAIPKLFETANWQMIGNLIDADVDKEINRLIMDSLFDKPATGIKKDYQILFITKNDASEVKVLAELIFSRPQAAGMEDLIKLLIDKGDQHIFSALAEFTFSQPHTAKMKNLIRNLIENGDTTVLDDLAQFTFSQPHTAGMTDLIKLLIDKGSQTTLRHLAIYTFSQPHTAQMKDLIRTVIEKADQVILGNLVSYTFSQPHAVQMKDLIKIAIEKGDQNTWVNLAYFTFAQPHATQMKDLIKTLIEKNNPMVWQALAASIFTKPHATGMKDTIRLLIEKRDQGTLVNLAKYAFSQPHTAGMNDLIKLLIQYGDSLVLQVLAHSALDESHIPDRLELIKFFIEKGDVDSFHDLSKVLRNQKGPEIDIFKKAISRKGSQADRVTWMNQELQKIDSPLVVSVAAPTVSIEPISPSLQIGDIVVVRNRRLKVVNVAGEGRRGIVYQVKAENGASYALKVAKSNDTDTLASLANESSKAAAWQRLGIPHAKVLVQEKNYVLKPWFDGLIGDEVIKRVAAGDELLKPAAQSLLAIVTKIRNHGAYIGDFRPANLIWTGKAWVIIDSGSIQSGMTLEEAQAKWNTADHRGPKFERRWQMKPPPMTCEKAINGQ